MRKTLPLIALLSTAALVPLACSKDPVVPSLSLDAGFGLGPTDAGPQPPATGPVGSAPADAAAPDAGPAAVPSVAASALAQAIDSALDLAMSTQAGKDAPGMAPEGAPGRATLQQNEHFNMIVNMAPGRCYTVIAMSAPLQVSELEVKLLAPPLYNIEAGRSPATDKNPAVLGRGKNMTCPLLPVAIPYKVDVTAKTGAGRILVQVFSKSK